MLQQPITKRSPAPVLMAYIREHGLSGLWLHLHGDGIRIRNDGMLDRRTVVGRALGRYESEIAVIEADRRRASTNRSYLTMNQSH